MRRFFDTANKYLKDTPSYLLDVPHLREAGSIDFFANNLNNMKRFIENLNGKKISRREIKNAIILINKKRRLLKKYSQISTKLPEIISISSYFKVMELSMISAPEIFTDDLERYLKFIMEADAENMTNLQPNYKNTPAIMIIGNFVTEEKLWGMLSTMNLKLASDDLCISSRYFEKQIELGDYSGDYDFLNLIAERYLNKPQCMRMADSGLKLKEIENNIIKNNIEGVIFISLKFCDTMLYSFPLLKQKLNDLGIPALYLEIEYNNFSEGQLKTRVQAFLEML